MKYLPQWMDQWRGCISRGWWRGSCRWIQCGWCGPGEARLELLHCTALCPEEEVTREVFWNRHYMLHSGKRLILKGSHVLWLQTTESTEAMLELLQCRVLCPRVSIYRRKKVNLSCLCTPHSNQNFISSNRSRLFSNLILHSLRHKIKINTKNSL